MDIRIKDQSATIVSTELLTKDTVSIWVKVPCADFKAGQFAMLECPSLSLRRPFVIADGKTNELRFVFKIRGKGTDLLSKLKIGTQIKVLAPLGNFFSPPFDTNITPLLVGGGLGTVTLLPLAKYLHSLGFKNKILLGAGTEPSFILLDELKKYGELVLCTDDGTCGTKCNVAELATKYIEKNPASYNIYACGPNPMLNCISKYCVQKNIKVYVSMEEKMACGVGACVCCVVKTKEGLKRVCKDGPIFDGGLLV